MPRVTNAALINLITTFIFNKLDADFQAKIQNRNHVRAVNYSCYIINKLVQSSSFHVESCRVLGITPIDFEKTCKRVKRQSEESPIIRSELKYLLSSLRVEAMINTKYSNFLIQ